MRKIVNVKKRKNVIEKLTNINFYVIIKGNIEFQKSNIEMHKIKSDMLITVHTVG